MTTKILSGTYANGYTLSAAYTGVSVTSTGSVTAGHDTTYTGNGLIALTLPNAGTVINSGKIQGGDGAYGYTVWYDGGAGGVALLLSNGGSVINKGDIRGGDGGDGANAIIVFTGRYQQNGYYYPGSYYKQRSATAGGAGAAGIVASATTQITNLGVILGGAGGEGAFGGAPFDYGGSGYYFTAGGPGGSGVVMEAGGRLLNRGTIEGGAGPGIGYEAPAGAGVDLQAGGTVINLGLIEGGVDHFGITPSGLETGINLEAGGIVTNGDATHHGALIEGGFGVSLSGVGTVTNFGTIEGGPNPQGTGAAVKFASSGDVLIAESGSDFIGGVIGGGGTLELAGGVGTVTGLGGTTSLTGAVSATITGFGAYEIGAGSAWTLAGGNHLAAAQGLGVAGALSNAGTFSQAGIVTVADGTIDNTGVWMLANGIALAAGETGVFNNYGTLVRTAATGANNINVDFYNRSGVVEIDGGTLFLNGPVNKIAGVIEGAGTLGFGGGVTLVNADLTEGGVAVKGAATVVDFNLGIAFDFGGVWTQSGGTLSVAPATRLALTGTGDSFSGTITGPGSVDFAGGTDSFKTLTLSTAHTAIGAVQVTMTGPIVLTGQVVATGSSLTVAATGAALSGGGTLQLMGAADTVTGATASARLTNADRIMGGGHIGGGSMALFNLAAGAIDGTGALTIDTGTQSIVNAGLIEAAGAGVVTIASAVNNSGTLEANKGTLNVNGAVTGAGKLIVENGGVADLTSAFSQAVSFVVGGGVLELAHSQGYSGTVTGFKNAAAKLDLDDIAFGAGTKATYSGTAASGVLTVTDGSHTSHIHLAGNFTGSSWTLASDGHGGTTVVDPPAAAPASAAPLISAMASFPPTAGIGGIHPPTSASGAFAHLLIPPRSTMGP